MYTFIHLQLGARSEVAHVKFFGQLAKRLKSDFRIIIADNQCEGGNWTGRIYKLGVANTYREFSGWEAARRFVIDRDLVGRGVFISNDTLLRHHVFDGPRVNSFLQAITECERFKRKRFLVGEVHDFPCPPPYLGGSPVKSYVPTTLVYFDPEGFRSVASFTPDVERGFCFESRVNSESVLDFSNGQRSPYFDYLESFLYKPGPGPKWYGHQPLGSHNYAKMKLKLHSVLLEHQLSQSFVESGGALVDTRVYLRRNFAELLSVYSKRVVLYIDMKTRRV